MFYKTYQISISTKGMNLETKWAKCLVCRETLEMLQCFTRMISFKEKFSRKSKKIKRKYNKKTVKQMSSNDSTLWTFKKTKKAPLNFPIVNSTRSNQIFNKNLSVWPETKKSQICFIEMLKGETIYASIRTNKKQPNSNKKNLLPRKAK